MLDQIILKELKTNLISQGEITPVDFIQQWKIASDKIEFYLDEIIKNLIEPLSTEHDAEYNSGGGKELDDKKVPAKMKSLHSSSAMTFNLFGNNSAIILPNQFSIKCGQYSVEFEKKLLALKPRAKANLDACLVSDDQLSAIFCEMKMFEWFRPTSTDVNQAYHDNGRYLSAVTFPTFSQVFNQLKNSGIVRYDALQMMKHTLGIYNALYASRIDSHKEFSKVKNVTLLNCVWEVTNTKALGECEKVYLEMVAEEHEEFIKFRELYQPIIQLFKDELQVDLSLIYMAHKEFIDILEKSPEELKYLQRYDIR